MEDEVIDLIVAVDGDASVFWLVRAEELYDLLHARDGADGLSGFHVYGGGLGFSQRREGGDLAVVETRWLAECLEPYGCWVETVEFCERLYGVVPPV